MKEEQKTQAEPSAAETPPATEQLPGVEEQFFDPMRINPKHWDGKRRKSRQF